ncbi:hypothetical protein CB0940_11775 [Cercospora beticola]|uniref:Uncharacterized protein n=1 Tax=Cercospora beticola TaxID=122368 RepID=A0A2G5IDC9_CERBT|nr:hypothetical protein CB0940_11775 [Cercospora beticola]PIB02791.1 hypothetical protein CB0940_11775 [Cercospora beticola]WPB04134.1 hypothetical protein RHO25_008778 [Cercospora beticola]
MSGIHGQVVGHLAKRGYEAVQEHMSQLQHDATLYDQAGPEMEVQPWEMLPVIVTGFLTLLLIAAIRYTVGEVVASLAMIESPTTTAIVQDNPPAYADEPDAPIEKEPLMPSEAEADVEVTLINNKPVTSSIRASVRHLTNIGGFRGRFRGAAVSVVYHFAHSLLTNFLSGLLGMGLFGSAIMYIVASLGLARLHMVWTHTMIGQPVAQPFYRRFVPRKQCKAILLPSLVFAMAQQATLLLPLIVAVALGLPDIDHSQVTNAAKHDCSKLVWMALRFLAVPATGLFVAFAILLPATVTLTRIEALLLPEDQDTIVPFDRSAIVGNVDITAKGSSRAIFIQAWRSFDSSARWRLIKLYVKMAAMQIGVIFVSVHLMVAEIYVIGGERLGLLIKSALAQMQLAAIEANGEN